jgi:serine phosphatase RsbU (regulator of sigma subunit)
VESSPLALAKQINKHLSRYTPSDRFATAVFIVLSPDSGELTYVNAGHNAPIVFSSGSTTFLEATGPPLGLFVDAEYDTRTAVLSPGSTLPLQLGQDAIVRIWDKQLEVLELPRNHFSQSRFVVFW